MNGLTVRRAEERDIARIMDLLEQVNLVHHLGRPDLFKRATKYTREELKEIISDDERPVFVCAESEAGSAEERVLGHAFCVRMKQGNSVLTDISTLYIDDICVDEAARGKGVGKMLYGHVEDFARKEGFYNLTLNVWALNPGAKAFYDSCGLSVQKYGMEKVLTE